MLKIFFLNCVFKKEMSYSFLSDAFPTWKEKSALDVASAVDLYENFDATASPPRTPPATSHKDKATDMDLRTDHPLDTNRGPGPQPFDSTSDYFKILSNNWEKVTNKYQSQARAPFGMEEFAGTNSSTDFLEEEQLGHESQKGCMSVAKHIDDCASCRNRLEQIFRKLLSPSSAATNVQPKQKNILSDMGDLLILVGIGLFVIFILHGFVKLGRFLRS
jgi:hypothetical protein